MEVCGFSIYNLICSIFLIFCASFTITNCFDMIADDGSADTYGGSACSALVDVDNVSNIKLRFGTANEQGAQFRGHSTALITGVIFKRIGDT